ncbi:MAG: hypothetical protein R3248_13545 [Candidatus Promineifilaceae bacterium]|nr:hypothetical protein [Candidatus Promineifilaceae bacterium]
MDVFVMTLPGVFAAYVVNVALAAAAGAFVLLLLAQRRPAAAMANFSDGSHVAAHKETMR